MLKSQKDNETNNPGENRGVWELKKFKISHKSSGTRRFQKNEKGWNWWGVECVFTWADPRRKE